MQNTPIKPLSPTNNSITSDTIRGEKVSSSEALSPAAADSVIVSLPAARPKIQDNSDPSSLVASLTKALRSTDAISSAHGNLDSSRVQDLLSED